MKVSYWRNDELCIRTREIVVDRSWFRRILKVPSFLENSDEHEFSNSSDILKSFEDKMNIQSELMPGGMLLIVASSHGRRSPKIPFTGPCSWYRLIYLDKVHFRRSSSTSRWSISHTEVSITCLHFQGPSHTAANPSTDALNILGARSLVDFTERCQHLTAHSTILTEAERDPVEWLHFSWWGVEVFPGYSRWRVAVTNSAVECVRAYLALILP